SFEMRFCLKHNNRWLWIVCVGNYHLLDCFILLTDAVTNSFKTFLSTSSRVLIYKHPMPVLYFPSFFSRSACTSKPWFRYTVRACLRGEKPVNIQSPSRPLAP